MPETRVDEEEEKKDGTPLLRDNHSDVNSQEDDRAEERKE